MRVTGNNDNFENPYILIYDDHGHLDIPHGGTDGNGPGLDTVLRKIKQETGINASELSIIDKAPMDYYYYENASKFLPTVLLPENQK